MFLILHALTVSNLTLFEIKTYLSFIALQKFSTPPSGCTKTYVTDVGSCAATTSSDGKTSAKACWDHCNFWGHAIVWKYGTCGCVHITNLGTCTKGTSNDFEYHETDPTSCAKGNADFPKISSRK